jgi:hypothetical protein
LATRTHAADGQIKGQPLRFVRFHHLRQFQRTGENHPRWLGDEVEYRQLHVWVNYSKEKTGRCAVCGRARYTEWANISGAYLRDLDDYAEMCKPCHSEFDSFSTA